MITLNHNIIFSKIDSPLDVPHASECESSDDHDLMTEHATLSTNSEHSKEDFVNPCTGGSSSRPGNADSDPLFHDHQARMGCGARDCQLQLQPGLSDDQKLAYCYISVPK